MEDPARPNDGRPTHTGQFTDDEIDKHILSAADEIRKKSAGAGEKLELSDDEILERAAKITETRAAQANEI